MRGPNVTGAGFFPIGVAVRAAGSADTSVRVRLNGTSMVWVSRAER